MHKKITIRATIDPKDVYAYVSDKLFVLGTEYEIEKGHVIAQFENCSTETARREFDNAASIIQLLLPLHSLREVNLTLESLHITEYTNSGAEKHSVTIHEGLIIADAVIVCPDKPTAIPNRDLLNQSVPILSANTRAQVAMEDFIEGVKDKTKYSVIHLARAIEEIEKYFGEQRGKRSDERLMREELGLNKQFVGFVTQRRSSGKYRTGHAHEKEDEVEEITPEERQECIQRTKTIIVKFLEYLREKNHASQ